MSHWDLINDEMFNSRHVILPYHVADLHHRRPVGLEFEVARSQLCRNNKGNFESE